MSGSSSERWLQPVVEILTVGLPFCAFKLLTGVIVTRSVQPLGYLLIVLGAIDLALNTANLAALVAVHRRVSSVCLVELVLRGLGRRAELGLAIDVFLSFGLVALVIGFSWIPRIPATALPLWNLAVVLNVLGAGVGRLYGALRPVSSVT